MVTNKSEEHNESIFFPEDGGSIFLWHLAKTYENKHCHSSGDYNIKRMENVLNCDLEFPMKLYDVKRLHLEIPER